MTSFIVMCHILIHWFSCLGIALRIWLSMGDVTRGDEGKLWVDKVEGVFFSLWGGTRENSNIKLLINLRTRGCIDDKKTILSVEEWSVRFTCKRNGILWR
jgi:hypothetical protein